MPIRPHDSQCGDLVGSNIPVRRKMKKDDSYCSHDAKYNQYITENLAIAVCGFHYPERVSGDY